MRSSRAVPFLALSAALGLTLASCGFANGGDGSGGSTTSAGGGLTFSTLFAPSSNFAVESDDAVMLSQIGCLETLIRYDEVSGELKPLLASEWSQTEPLAWDVTLRDDVTFQNGTRLTAETVATALNYVLGTDAPPRAFSPSVVSSVEVVDEDTVRVVTPEESALLPYRLASVNTGILAPEAYTDAGTDPMGTCTGPFAITDYAPGQSLRLEPNTDYWGGDVPLDRVEVQFIPEGTARATQIQTGEADIAGFLPATSIADVEADSEVTVTRTFTPRTTGLHFNTSRPPFDDPNVRRAVQAALDLDSIAQNVFDGVAEPAIGPFAPEEPWAPNGAPVEQDLELARELLAQAGYAPGELNVELLGYTERPDFADLAAVVQANLAEIGIGVTVNIAEYAAIEPALLEGTYDMTLLSRNHLIDIADPMGFLTSDYTCEGSFNVSHYCDPEFDAILGAAGSESDPDARYDLYAEAAQKLQDEAVTAFIVHEQSVTAVRNNVVGFVDDPLNRYAITAELALED
ncbi:ABC transporter substrate-binding protein [Georgenia sp. SUBG003]|uniref:ABC transporter substrate-binding protein n=1 Tax=Georgenia sp. SUBG003 TaxID=1497974 RepID=UPI0004D96680|nr:peptide ABC transporter [Georgenia sp. SUBG003]